MNHTSCDTYDKYKYYIEGYYKSIPSFKYYKDEKRDEYNYLYGIKTGIKWECIEFIRRFLIEKRRLYFELVDNVYDMINIKYFINLDTLKPISLNFYRRNSNFKPKVNDLVLFYYKNTGHIAIISHISNIHVLEICEQNWENNWESSRYSRRILSNDPSIIGFIRI